MAGCGCGSSSGQCLCAIEGNSPIVVTGAGSATVPYEVDLELSTDPNNLAVLGTDGGLYVPDSETSVGCFVDSNGSGIPPDDDGCIRVPQWPLIKDQGGDFIEPDGDLAIRLPANTAPSYGAGLKTDGSGTLLADVAGVWPLAPLAGPAFVGTDTSGAPVYVDSTGQLRTIPEHTAVVASLGSTSLFNTVAVLAAGATYTSPSSGTVTITNPSPTRTMRVVGLASVTASASGGTDPIIVSVERDIGSGFVTWSPYSSAFPYSTGPAIIDEKAWTGHYSVALAPGASHSINLRVKFDYSAASGGGATRRAASVKVDLVGITQ